MNWQVYFVLLFVSVCVAVSAFTDEEILEKSWQKFKIKYKKEYKASDMERSRRLIWERNNAYVKHHNFEASKGVQLYTLGENAFSDMTHTEFLNTMVNGYKMPENETMTNEIHDVPTMDFSNTTDLPQEVNWRDRGVVTRVKNQGSCGSCWAFSAIGALEGQHALKYGRLVSLSEQNILDCIGTAYGSNSCSGGYINSVFQYIRDNKGVDVDRNYPYTGVPTRCKFKRSDVGASDIGYVNVPHNSEITLQKAVAEIGPISIAIDAGLQSFHLYRSGIYNDPKCSPHVMNHCVVAVGYGTENGVDYWLLKNSWGTSWGEEGYIRIIRNDGNRCGVAAAPSYPLV